MERWVVGVTAAATPAATPTDPNWLYSTIAQCTAALVAIIGGFLVSRVINISQEREGLQRRRRGLAAQATAAADEAQELKEARLRLSAAWFVEEQGPAIVAGDVTTSFQALDAVPQGSTADEMAPLATAMFALAGQLATIDLDAVNLLYLSAEHELPLTGVEAMVSEERDRRDRERRAAERLAAEQAKEEDPVGYLSWRVESWDATIDDLRLPRMRTGPEVAEHQRTIEAELGSAARLRALQAELAIVTAEIDRLATIPGLTRALHVLAFFAVGGIVLPLVLETLRPVPDGGIARVGAVLVFVSGLVALGDYLAATVLRSASPSHDDAESSLLGPWARSRVRRTSVRRPVRLRRGGEKEPREE